MSIKKAASRTLNLMLVAAVVVAAWAATFHSDWIVAGPPKVSAQSIPSDKADPECVGQETAGRCADSCPNASDTLQGFDKETGAAVCRAAVTGCPYGDSIPADSEKCEAPESAVYNDNHAATAADLGGK